MTTLLLISILLRAGIVRSFGRRPLIHPYAHALVQLKRLIIISLQMLDDDRLPDWILEAEGGENVIQGNPVVEISPASFQLLVLECASVAACM